MAKIKNIEFLRVLLMFCIVMMHSFTGAKWGITNIYPDISLYEKLNNCFRYCNNGVEAFFIISGFLLVITFKSETSIKDFIIKKYRRLSPVILATMGICAIGYFCGVMEFPVWKNILAVLLLNTPFISVGAVSCGSAWFTSALFLNLLTYFCLFKFVPKKWRNFIMIVLIVLAYGLLEYFRHGNYSHPTYNIKGFLNVGYLRAVGGVGAGCFIGLFYKKYWQYVQQYHLSKSRKFVYNLFEISLFAFIIYWSFLPHARINSLVYVIAFAFLFTFFVLKKGLISQFFEKDIWVKLGKYQYSIFIIHTSMLKILYGTFCVNNPNFVRANPLLTYLIIYTIILLTAFVMYNCVEKPCARIISNKIKTR